MKEDLFKTPKVMYDFYLQFCDIFTMNLYDGNGRKPRNMYKRKNKENSPFGCPPTPVYENAALRFTSLILD